MSTEEEMHLSQNDHQGKESNGISQKDHRIPNCPAICHYDCEVQWKWVYIRDQPNLSGEDRI